MTEERMPEADEMLATAERLAKNAYDNRRAAQKAAAEAGKDYTRNQRYLKASAEFDAFCEALAHLMWIRKHFEAGGAPISEYPSKFEAAQYIEAKYGEK